MHFRLIHVYTFVIFTFHPTSNSILREIATPNDTIIETFLAFLISHSSRENFRFALHLDSSSAVDLTDLFPPNLESERIIFAYSPNQTKTFRRPIGLKFINIVLLRHPSTFEVFSQQDGNVRPHDAAVFVLSESLLSEEDQGMAFWRKNKTLTRFTNVVFAATTPNEVKLYDTCFFCGSRSGALRPIDSVTLQNIFPDYFLDFNGHEFLVLYQSYPPIISCASNTTEGRCEGGLNGPEGNIFNAIRKSLNFTSTLMDFESMPESQRGLDENTGIWDVLITRMSEGLGDLALGSISLTLPRTLLTPFTQIFNREPHDFVYVRFPGAPIGVVGPFSTALWIALALSWIFTSLLICLFIPCRRVLCTEKLSTGLWATGAILVGQPSSTPPMLLRSRSVRVIILSWSWFSFILITLYSSNLVSSLITPALPLDPSSLEDLLLHRYEIVTAKSSIMAVRDLINSSDPVYRTFGRKMKVLQSPKESAKYLMESIKSGHRVALVDESSSLRWGMLERIRDEKITERLRVGGVDILASGHAWALSRDGVALIPALDQALGAVIASGLPRFWIDGTLPNGSHPIQSGSQSRSQQIGISKPLSIQLFAASLIIWAGGLLASSISFTVEMCLYRRRVTRSDTN